MQTTDSSERISDTPSGKDTTNGIALLMGDPKQAIIKLSGPMIIAMFLMSTYNIVNAIWVAGLGSDALAAVGFVTPLFMILIGLSNGLGAGVASVISRRIGAKDKTGADNAAVHALLLVLILSAILTIPLILLTGPIVTFFGAGETAGLATEYGQVIFLGMILILFTNIAYAILRAEGDTRRAMYVMGASSILNMILDPILIYTAGMGIAGAAWGMIVSLIMVSGVLLYWFFGKKDTYVTISFASFSWDKKTLRDILGVGLPGSIEFFLMAILSIFINSLLVLTAGTDAVAVYTAGWRVVFFAIIPMIAISTSVISVAGAAYGARQYEEDPDCPYLLGHARYRDLSCDQRYHVPLRTSDRLYLHLFRGQYPPRTGDCGIPCNYVSFLPVRAARHHVSLGLPGNGQGADLARDHGLTEPGLHCGLRLPVRDRARVWGARRLVGDRCRGYSRGCRLIHLGPVLYRATDCHRVSPPLFSFCPGTWIFLPLKVPVHAIGCMTVTVLLTGHSRSRQSIL